MIEVRIIARKRVKAGPQWKPDAHPEKGNVGLSLFLGEITAFGGA